jgi:hypothetical protein
MRGIKRSSKMMPPINSLFKIKSLVQHAPMMNGMLGTSRMVRGLIRPHVGAALAASLWFALSPIHQEQMKQFFTNVCKNVPPRG